MNPLERTYSDQLNIKAMKEITAEEDAIIKKRMEEAWKKNYK